MELGPNPAGGNRGGTLLTPALGSTGCTALGLRQEVPRPQAQPPSPRVGAERGNGPGRTGATGLRQSPLQLLENLSPSSLEPLFEGLNASGERAGRKHRH